MNTLCVQASHEYNVHIGSGLLQRLGTYAASIRKSGNVAIISDSNVFPLYGCIIETSLKNSGFHTASYVFPAGEASKTPETYFEILRFLAMNHFTRSDLIVALGGGVVGDMAGFVASTYLRGISYIQVPTSLLAMVDSSVGGKTAIDLPEGKNLVGAFYQPSLVLCDLDVLSTLPDSVFRDGCAEVIKYGILFDKSLFEHLANEGLAFDRKSVITRCIELKRNVVKKDEFDTGLRQKLNLGHTFGHSIEALSRFAITHGQAVAIGMVIISNAASVKEICDYSVARQIYAILEAFALPTATNFTARELFTHALSDKKRTGNTVTLVVPKDIGNCILLPTPVDQLESFIEAGL